jgi:hypothetical protein
MANKSSLTNITPEGIVKFYNNTRDKKLFPRIIELFYELDEDKNRSLTIKEAINLGKGRPYNFRKNLQNILTRIAGKDNKIDIYEWILLNYLIDSNKNPSDNSIDYIKFQEIKDSLSKLENKYKYEYIQNDKKLEYGRTLEGLSIKEIYNNLYKNNTKIQQVSQQTQQQSKQIQQIKKIQKQQTQPPQQKQQTQQTQLPQKIQKKIELVENFNENLKSFKEDYKSVKELIKINNISFSKPFINVSFENTEYLNEKFNIIINQNQNTNNCKKIINQNTIKQELKQYLKENNPNTINIKIFILLCYYINQLNCILNEFDNELKKEYKSGSRFNNNTIDINYLKTVLQKIINNSNDEIKIEQICTNVNNILDIILEIFTGIHSDLSITLIEEITAEQKFSSLLRTTKSTSIDVNTKIAYKSLVNAGFISNNNSKQFENLLTNLDKQDKQDEINNNINDYIKFYDFLKYKKLDNSIKSKSDTSYKQSKQKILNSIIDKVIDYQKKYNNTLPEYKFLDANTIYENESN